MAIDGSVVLKEKLYNNMEKIGKQYPKIASDCPSDDIRVNAQMAVLDSYKNGWVDAIDFYNALLQGTIKIVNESR